MTPTISPPPTVARRPTRRATASSPRQHSIHIRRGHRAPRRPHVLARYTDWHGHPREVTTAAGSAGSVLVLDRDLATRGDRRLIAHLAADEPPENAALVCVHYLEEVRRGGGRCRCVVREDFETVPFADELESADGLEFEPHAASHSGGGEPLDAQGRRYGLELLQTGMSIPQLRWCRHPPLRADGELQPVSVREAVACLESYEPVRTLTRRALALHRPTGEVSTAALRAELQRLQVSPIVLNRTLREAVVATIERQGLSLSAIAIRCGRIKRDSKGNESGETSWLARRLGMLAESGHDTPTPWIHSDVLALIARRGLGVSPREVEA
jgi:hypothetical protein